MELRRGSMLVAVWGKVRLDVFNVHGIMKEGLVEK